MTNTDVTTMADDSPALRVAVAGATHLGRTRQTNEDAYLITYLGGNPGMTDVRSDRPNDTSRPLLLAISDGVGGSQAGEVASALTLDAFRRALPSHAEDWGHRLLVAVERANQAVWTAGQAAEHRGMGATLTGVCVHHSHAYVVEVGDSRAYLIRGAEIRQLTHDQSFVQALLDAGLLSPEQASRSSLKNMILAAIGSEPDVTADLARVDVQPDDTLVLCSDGLSNELDADQIQASVQGSPTPHAACARLIEAANGHGGRDNITTIVATFTA